MSPPPLHCAKSLKASSCDAREGSTQSMRMFVSSSSLCIVARFQPQDVVVAPSCVLGVHGGQRAQELVQLAQRVMLGFVPLPSPREVG